MREKCIFSSITKLYINHYLKETGVTSVTESCFGINKHNTYRCYCKYKTLQYLTVINEIASLKIHRIVPNYSYRSSLR